MNPKKLAIQLGATLQALCYRDRNELAEVFRLTEEFTRGTMAEELRVLLAAFYQLE